MKVICPDCLSVYNVRYDAMPPEGAKAKCPRCGCMIPLKAEPVEIKISSDQDYGRTMVLFMPLPAQQEEQLREVQAGLSGAKEHMPDSKEVVLKVIEGDEPGREYALRKPRTILGRSRADVLVNDPEVSRQHASIELYGDKMVVKDLGSTNGTFVNRMGVRLSYLKDGDELQVGNTRFRLIAR